MEQKYALIRENIAKNLTSLRKKKGITQLELAEKFNYSDKAISKWERGETIPDIETLCSLADFYDVSLNYIVYGKEDKEFINKEKPEYNKPILITLYSLIPLLISSITFAVFSLIFKNNFWWISLWGLSTSFITFFVLSIIFLSKKVWTTCGILMSWMILISTYFTLVTFLPNSNGWNTWPVLLIGLPLTLCFILFNNVKKKTVDNK